MSKAMPCNTQRGRTNIQCLSVTRSTRDRSVYALPGMVYEVTTDHHEVRPTIRFSRNGPYFILPRGQRLGVSSAEPWLYFDTNPYSDDDGSVNVITQWCKGSEFNVSLSEPKFLDSEVKAWASFEDDGPDFSHEVRLDPHYAHAAGEPFAILPPWMNGDNVDFIDPEDEILWAFNYKYSIPGDISEEDIMRLFDKSTWAASMKNTDLPDEVAPVLSFFDYFRYIPSIKNAIEALAQDLAIISHCDSRGMISGADTSESVWTDHVPGNDPWVNSDASPGNEYSIENVRGLGRIASKQHTIGTDLSRPEGHGTLLDRTDKSNLIFLVYTPSQSLLDDEHSDDWFALSSVGDSNEDPGGGRRDPLAFRMLGQRSGSGPAGRIGFLVETYGVERARREIIVCDQMLEVGDGGWRDGEAVVLAIKSEVVEGSIAPFCNVITLFDPITGAVKWSDTLFDVVEFDNEYTNYYKINKLGGDVGSHYGHGLSHSELIVCEYEKGVEITDGDVKSIMDKLYITHNRRITTLAVATDGSGNLVIDCSADGSNWHYDATGVKVKITGMTYVDFTGKEEEYTFEIDLPGFMYDATNKGVDDGPKIARYIADKIYSDFGAEWDGVVIGSTVKIKKTPDFYLESPTAGDRNESKLRATPGVLTIGKSEAHYGYITDQFGDFTPLGFPSNVPPEQQHTIKRIEATVFTYIDITSASSSNISTGLYFSILESGTGTEKWDYYRLDVDEKYVNEYASTSQTFIDAYENNDGHITNTLMWFVHVQMTAEDSNVTIIPLDFTQDTH